MIQVLVSGALGRMGTEICKAVDSADDMRLVAGVDPSASDDTTVGTDNAPVFLTLKEAIEVTRPDVVIDFTRPDVAEANVRCALSMGVNCVLGTTGLSEERLQEIYDESATGDAALFHAPNFTTGAVLMMLFAQQAAKYFPDIEVIEFHHDGKKDAPSGTAIRTARLIAEARDGASDAPGQGDGAFWLRGRSRCPRRWRAGACGAYGGLRRAPGGHLWQHGPDAHHTP